jgi:MinD-like ATPase involved in chromosome partitioning or flagellar assembly
MDSTDDIPSYSFSPEQHLSIALENLAQAYIRLEEEEEEEREEIKEQVEQLVYYTRSILLGENPFI